VDSSDLIDEIRSVFDSEVIVAIDACDVVESLVNVAVDTVDSSSVCSNGI
jgi:hypothetical protein